MAEAAAPLDGTAVRVIEGLRRLDLFETYRKVRSPLLVVSAERFGIEDSLQAPLRKAFDAYREGIIGKLEEVADELDLTSLVSLPTSHDVHLEAPDALVEEILRHVEIPSPTQNGGGT